MDVRKIGNDENDEKMINLIKIKIYKFKVIIKLKIDLDKIWVVVNHLT